MRAYNNEQTGYIKFYKRVSVSFVLFLYSCCCCCCCHRRHRCCCCFCHEYSILVCCRNILFMFPTTVITTSACGSISCLWVFFLVGFVCGFNQSIYFRLRPQQIATGCLKCKTMNFIQVSSRVWCEYSSKFLHVRVCVRDTRSRTHSRSIFK